MTPEPYTIRVVTSSAELYDALSNDNGVDYVYLGEDIELKSGISINPQKTAVIINGRYPDNETGVIHTFTDMASNTLGDTLNISSTVNGIELTIKNIHLVGHNYYGIPYVPDLASLYKVSVTYDNVTYVGPQLTFNPYGLNRYIDCEITIEYPLDPNRVEEVGEVNRLEIGGKTVIHHNNNENAVFWFHGDRTTAYFKVLPNADFSVETSSYFMYNTWAFPTYPVPVAYTIMTGASFLLKSPMGISKNQDHRAASFMVNNDATFRYIQTSPSGAFASLYLNGAMTVQAGARVYMEANYSGAAPLIHFVTANGKITLEDPKSFVLYSKSGPVLSFAEQIPFILSGGQLNYWEASIPFPTAGTFEDTPYRKWYKDDYVFMSFEGTVSGNGTQVTNTNLTPEEAQKRPQLTDLRLQVAHVLSVGKVALAVNTIVDNQTPVTGTGDPDANIKATYVIGSETFEKKAAADIAGAFTVYTDSSIPIGTEVTMAANTPFLIMEKPYTVVDAGELSITYAPEDIYFDWTPISTNPVILPRQIVDDPVTVNDTRVYSSEWELFAAIEKPMESDEGHILRDAVVFADSEGKYWTLGQTPLVVYTGDPNGGSPKTTSVTWGINRGILVRITDPVYNNETYKTRLLWSVEPI